MTLRLGINGFGRIGRSILRALLERTDEDMRVVAINDLAPLETLAHLFEFDSLHGRLNAPLVVENGTLDPGTGPIRVSADADPARLDWGDVDIALECSGVFTRPDLAAVHLANGARRVLISAPATGPLKTIVYGINHASITADDTVLSNTSCTTNCLVPVAQVLHAAFGIARGHMTTVHCYTGNQGLHDGPHGDLYRARAAALSMIPTTTGAARAMDAILPQLAGRVTGTAIRVPTPNVSCIDLVVETESATTAQKVNAAFVRAAGRVPNVLGTTNRKLVSVDFRRDPRSAIIACDQTTVQDGNLVRVLAWYDNEWGFSNRMLDTARVMGGFLSAAPGAAP